MFDLEEGEKAVKIARDVIDRRVKGKSIPQYNTPDIFLEKSGVFTTINTFRDKRLRGCIGFPEAIFPLIKALIESAQSAATSDPRFPPLQKKELKQIVIEVSLLTPPKLIQVNDVKDYSKNIEIGKDGLIIESSIFKGLLLPQVPIEWGWNEEEFLSHTCLKAGLSKDAWLDRSTKIYKFSGEVFQEVEPYGKIVRKELKKC